MSRERFSGKEIISSGVLFIATLAVADSMAHGQVDTSKKHSAPVAILPSRTVLLAPKERLQE